MNSSTIANERGSDAKRRFDDVRSGLYVVSVTKFVLLYLFTGGGYIIYWSYRNWTSFRGDNGVSITPALRAVFWPFFILDLFDRIQKRLDAAGRSYAWYSETRALLIMLVVMIATVLSMFFDGPSDARFLLMADVALIAGCMFLFVGAQRAINLLCDDPQGSSNNGFSSSNVLWALLGGLGLMAFGYVVFWV